ncbi:MAG: hypothetical protein PVJ36_04270 [Nitrospirota bacterium]|jgi:hypothetical protein
MLDCWVCGYAIEAVPEEEEEAEDIEVVCPKCLTKHIYTEDADGNLVVTQAIRSDGRVITPH